MIDVLIVEDDPMIARINSEYLDKCGEFAVRKIAHNGRDALEYLRSNAVDLVILDVYMPGISGIELLRTIRAEQIRAAVIMVTAASEMKVVQEALRLGIVDYLIKPYTFARFQEAALRYIQKMNLLTNHQTASQSMIDRLVSNDFMQQTERSTLRKGLNQQTLRSIQEHMQLSPQDYFTCEGLAQAIGLSKVTVRRYLNYLIETEQITSSIDYETGGRPRVLYHLK